MADEAQRIATRYLEKFSGDNRRVLTEFDYDFATEYAGKPATSSIAAGGQFINRGAGATIAESWKGQTGFRTEFRETTGWNDDLSPGFHDQTHHFAFYVSMGINNSGVSTLGMLQRMHRLQDNNGDDRLGKAAFNIGVGLRRRPEGLRDIGQTIRSTICGS